VGRVRGDLSGYYPTEPSRRTESKLCGVVRSQEHGCWPRMAACPGRQPACYFCAVWVPGAVGEWRWRWFDVGQLTDVRGCTVERPILRAEMRAWKRRVQLGYGAAIRA
jgi:hypothetical protein